jgi:hypothetical protein
LTNVARYAGATEAKVAVQEEGARLVVTVVDDGRGGADPIRGSGLRGLADRVAAAGGSLDVSSPPGHGTTIRADLPLTAAPGMATVLAHNGSPDARRAPALAGPVRAVAYAAPRTSGGGRTEHPISLIAIAVGVIGLVAAGATVVASQSRAPIGGRTEAFARPFDYLIPGNADVKLFPGPMGSSLPSSHLHVFARAQTASEGITVWIVDDVLRDRCEIDAGLAPREPGATGLLAYMRTVDRLVIRNEAATTLDGRPATRLELSVLDHNTGCKGEGMSLWRDTSTEKGAGIYIPADGRVPLILTDVDGATVVFEIWSYAQLDDWLPTAEAIVDSVRFLHTPPGSTSPTTAPGS